MADPTLNFASTSESDIGIIKSVGNYKHLLQYTINTSYNNKFSIMAAKVVCLFDNRKSDDIVAQLSKSESYFAKIRLRG